MSAPDVKPNIFGEVFNLDVDKLGDVCVGVFGGADEQRAAREAIMSLGESWEIAAFVAAFCAGASVAFGLRLMLVLAGFALPADPEGEARAKQAWKRAP